MIKTGLGQIYVDNRHLRNAQTYSMLRSFQLNRIFLLHHFSKSQNRGFVFYFVYCSIYVKVG